MAQLEDADIGSEVAPAETDDASKQRVDMLVEVRRAYDAIRDPKFWATVSLLARVADRVSGRHPGVRWWLPLPRLLPD